MLFRSTKRECRKITSAQIEAWEKESEEEIVQMGKTLENKIEQNKQELGHRINLTEEIAIGAALATLDDPKKVPVMQERLKAFAACVRRGGGESCLKGE